MDPRVVIVGGGLAGLYAGRLLHRAGVLFRIFEARERLGGRVLTAEGFDLGPSWIWPDSQPRLSGLVRELGLEAFPQHGEGDHLFERSLREMPFRNSGDSPMAGAWRIAGGTSGLIRGLGLQVPPDSIRLGLRVLGLTLVPGGAGVRVDFEPVAPSGAFAPPPPASLGEDLSGALGTGLGAQGLGVGLGSEVAAPSPLPPSPEGSGVKVVAEQVIAALPPRLLEARVRFAPELDPKTARLWSETGTWMAPHAKFLALFDRPFWRKNGLSGSAHSLVGPLAEIHDATTFDGQAALFGFVGIPAGQRPREVAEKLALAQLERLFGPEAGRPIQTLWKDWTEDEFTAVETDAAPLPHLEVHPGPWVGEGWRERLSLAGSETGRIDPGYLEGALDASERAVSEVLARLV